MQYLIVVRSFGSHQVGDLITAEQDIDAILGSEHSTHVVRIIPPGKV